jgi:hypothetical protein
VFVIAAALALVGIVLALRIREPRKTLPADVVGQPGTLP